MRTLPDFLRPGLDLVFVGINPGYYSAQVGHYFANARNRFWTAFNAAEIAPEMLGPLSDSKVLEYGIGFTDIVKRPTRGMGELKQSEFKEGAGILVEKLFRYCPKVVCFNGVTGYKNFKKHTGSDVTDVSFGLQASRVAGAQVFVLPSTSPANAVVSLDRVVEGMLQLKALIISGKQGG